MLNIANEFYKMNNTKINFSKAELICNRSPNDPSLPLPKTPEPYEFSLENSPFSITPLTPTSSFRFLGVWFNLRMKQNFVKHQCRIEYQTFANTLRRKKLTVKQLTYLHNTVLLPKVEFRSQTSILSPNACTTIIRPMRAVIKHSSKFGISLLSAFLHSKNGIGMIDFFD